MSPLPDLLKRYKDTRFLVDEAFIGLAGQPVAHLVASYPNLLVTRTLSKAHSLAGFRVGYAVLPPDLAEDLNKNNDAYPLAKSSQAAAVATLQHEEKIRSRIRELRVWTEKLAGDIRMLGVQTFPTDAYFFLADFAPQDAAGLAERLRQHGILIKPLNDPVLGRGFMRVTTSLPDENRRVVDTLKQILRESADKRISDVT
jgi:histidinol-phosphate aminotransferase